MRGPTLAFSTSMSIPNCARVSRIIAAFASILPESAGDFLRSSKSNGGIFQSGSEIATSAVSGSLATGFSATAAGFLARMPRCSFFSGSSTVVLRIFSFGKGRDSSSSIAAPRVRRMTRAFFASSLVSFVLNAAPILRNNSAGVLANINIAVISAKTT